KHYQAEQAKAQKAQPAEPAEADKALVDEILADKTNHVLGNPNGKFVIIEFFDYQCGWCKKTNKEISAALKDAPNIRWVLMDTPIFGEASEQIARFAMAAGKQGKFKEYHEAIGNAKGKLDKDALIKLGKDLKLNTKRLAADAESQQIKDKLANNQKYARQLNINGVPMLIVDGKINPGALIGDRLADAVEASKAKK
ncbi:MAG: DsbA family protein, partial [Alphaproteobacteria bacterium]|nr:DsbA family protein [Alphaproteobacteria bacterium]